MTKLAAIALCLVATLAVVPAQSLNYADFSDVSQLVLNNNAAQSGNALRVAPSALLSKGSAYYSQPLSVVNGFDTTFTFQISGVSGVGGSGMAFVIHTDPRATTAIGDHAWAMGYAGFASNPAAALTNSLVLEMDMFQDANKNDPSSSHLSLHTNGTMGNDADENFSIGSYVTPGDMGDGTIHTIRIVYVPGTIQVYYDNSVMPVITAAYDFGTGGTFTAGGSVGGINLISSDFAYVGFSASMPNTTAQLQHHDVLTWNWASSMTPSFPGNGADVAIEVAVNGNTGTGQGGIYSIAPTDTIGFNFLSPAGTLAGQPFGAVATVFTTGMPPLGIPAQNVWIDPFDFFFLVDGFNPVTPFAPILSQGGFSYGPFAVPAGFAGSSTSLMLQTFTTAGGLGLSDAAVIIFQ